jgi:hypothetical protein
VIFLTFFNILLSKLQEKLIDVVKVQECLENNYSWQTLCTQAKAIKSKFLKRVQRDSVRVQRDSVRVQRDSDRVQRDSVRVQRDSVRVQCDSVRVQRDSVRVQGDSVRVQRDSVRVQRDSAGRVQRDSVGSALACCMAGPSSNPGSAPQGGFSL